MQIPSECWITASNYAHFAAGFVAGVLATLGALFACIAHCAVVDARHNVNRGGDDAL
jgi:hypothetical protein